mmetsp:Transcript_20182/g.55900  ORF Transcript_20182/g.55900 Transcript_20182/m.55900 type:complete len:345 (-) Transcript_20182:101-1135(-)
MAPGVPATRAPTSAAYWHLLVAALLGALVATVAHHVLGERWRSCWSPRGHYAALGVCESATVEEIRRTVVGRPSPQGAAAREAFRVLLDPLAKARHDFALAHGVCSGNAPRELVGFSESPDTEEWSPVISRRRGASFMRLPIQQHVLRRSQADAYQDLLASSHWSLRGDVHGEFWHHAVQVPPAATSDAEPRAKTDDGSCGGGVAGGGDATCRLVAGLLQAAASVVPEAKRRLAGISAIGLTYGMLGVSLADAARANASTASLSHGGALLVSFVRDFVGEGPDPGGELVLLGEDGTLQDFFAASVHVASLLPAELARHAILRPPSRRGGGGRLSVVLLLQFAPA